MTGFVIKHRETGKFVAPPGRERSYVTDIADAAYFPGRYGAKEAACGNEVVCRIVIGTTSCEAVPIDD